MVYGYYVYCSLFTLGLVHEILSLSTSKYTLLPSYTKKDNIKLCTNKTNGGVRYFSPPPLPHNLNKNLYAPLNNQ